MAKRKNKDPGGQRQVHPQRSFENMVADATLARLGGYIDGQMQELAQALLARQQRSLAGVVTRLRAAEEILMEKLGETRESIAERIAALEDSTEGFEKVEAVETGDRVRIEIKTRTADQTEFQGASRLQIENAGSGNTIGAELETALVGMKTGEVKEVTFGKDGSLVASLKIDRVSRQPKAPEAEAAEATQEAPNASADAG